MTTSRGFEIEVEVEFVPEMDEYGVSVNRGDTLEEHYAYLADVMKRGDDAMARINERLRQSREAAANQRMIDELAYEREKKNREREHRELLEKIARIHQSYTELYPWRD